MVPRAVLFDFDGVIADTENHHIAAWQRTLTALGWQVPEEVAIRSVEIDDREFIRELFAQHGIEDGDVEGWVRKKQLLTVSLIRNAPRVYPGVVELVRTLRGRVGLALVSATWRENVVAVLETAGLTDAFDTVVAKEDVGGVKPSPEAYLRSLENLAVRPEEAVAVEDSPSGLAAAQAANIPRIAIGHRREFGGWVGDADYITGFEPVSGFLEHLGLGQSNG